MKKRCSGMSCRPGRGKNNEYLIRVSGENSITVPFCSKTCPFHSLRKTIGLPTSQVVRRSEPYCHCLTSGRLVNASQTFFAGARIFTVESDVFTCGLATYLLSTIVRILRSQRRIGELNLRRPVRANEHCPMQWLPVHDLAPGQIG